MNEMIPNRQSEQVTVIDGPVGQLELIVEIPQEDAEDTVRNIVAIVCHPLSTEGGSMTNKVVTSAARALRDLGITTVRFNFRSVGQSEGEYDRGDGEIDDLNTIVDWVKQHSPDATIWLAGFSFGSYVSLCAASQIQPALLLSIAPPAGRWDFSQLSLPAIPWIVIQGEEDEIVDPEAVYAWFDAMPVADKHLLRIPEATHFFHRKLVELKDAVKQSVTPYLK